MKDRFLSHEEHLRTLKEGQETVIHINGRAYVVSVATEDDIERIGKGYFCID